MPRVKDDRSKYRKDFPFLDNIRTTADPGSLNRLGWEGYSDIRVRVKLANPQLMYREPEDAGPWPNARWESVSGSEPPHYKGKTSENLYVVTSQNVLSEPYAPQGLSHYTSVPRTFKYPRDIFRDYRFSEVAYVLLVTTVAWYDMEPSAEWATDGRHNRDQFVGREMRITIYKPPKDGWANLYRRSQLSDSHLMTRQVIQGIVKRDPEWEAISERLQQLAEEFESRVYKNGMREKIDSSDNRGMASQWGSVKVMTYVALGRVMITLDEPKHQVTFMASEDGEPRIGWHSIEGPLPQLERIVRTVIKGWELTENPASLHNDERGFSPWPGLVDS